jgi:hypothetical protein
MTETEILGFTFFPKPTDKPHLDNPPESRYSREGIIRNEKSDVKLENE